MKKIITALIVCLLFPLSSFSAIHEDTVWEIMQDATANNVNSGGFNASNAAPGTDRSQQTTAFDTGTDLASADGDASPCVVTSATHNFVADDNGNIIHITETGDGFTVGWYEVVSTAANAATLDRACGTDGAKTGGDWFLGGALSLNSTLDDEFFEQVVAGNTIWIKDNASDIQLGEAVSVGSDGTALLPLTIEGYKDARGDNPVLLDRPQIDTQAFGLVLDDFWTVKHLRVTGTGTSNLKGDNFMKFHNIFAYNSSTTSGRPAINGNHNDHLGTNCQLVSDFGSGYNNLFSRYEFYGSYFDGGRFGFNGGANTGGCKLVDNVFDSAFERAIDLDSNSNLVSNNTIVNSAIGVYADVSSNNVYTNNILDSNIIGMFQNSEVPQNYIDYNVWNNSTDTTNVTKGDNAITGDPGLNATIIQFSDGTTDGADQTKFEDTTNNPFGSVDTNDRLIIFSGTAVTAGPYLITNVVSASELTISAGATTGGSAITYGIVVGEDFTVGSGSNALDAGIQPGVNQGLEGDYKWNIGADQDDNTAAGGAGGSAGHVLVF